MKTMLKPCAFLSFFISLTTLSAQMAAPEYEWSKGIGSLFGDVGYSIAVDNKGYIITAGVFTELVNFNAGGNNPANKYGKNGDAFVTKHDSLGNLVWVQQIGGEGQDGALTAVTDEKGNVYVTGYFSGTADLDPGISTMEVTASTGTDIFIVKLTPNGDFMWAKHLNGGGNYTRPERMVFQPLGASFYITGSFSDTLDFDPNSGVTNLITQPFRTTGFIANYSQNGDLIWAKQFQGVDYGLGVSVGADGNVFITGIFADTAYFESGASPIKLASKGQSDIFVSKFKSDGELVWAKAFGDVNADWGYSIANDPQGNVLVTGMFSGIIDFDPGSEEVLLESRNWDVFVLKLNDAGEYVWARSFGSDQFDWGNAVTTDEYSNVYSTGFFNDTADFDPSPQAVELVAGAYNEIFIQKLDSSGNFVWAGQLKGSQLFDASDNQGFSIVVDKRNNIYTTGQFITFIDCDPGPLVDNIVAESQEGSGFYYSDVFIHKLSQASTVGFPDNSTLTGFNYYPNPTAELLTIDFNGYFATVDMEIIDLTGKVISNQTFTNSTSIHFNLKVPSGLYFIQLRKDKQLIGNFKVCKI